MLKISRRRLVSIFLVILQMCTLFQLGVTAMVYKYEKEAQLLHNMGIFDGISTTKFEPDLGTSLNRAMGIAMVVKMMGEKSFAEKMSVSDADKELAKFKDKKELKQDWQKKYVAYAISNDWVRGVSENTLSPMSGFSGKQLAKLLLINLKYIENTDFRFENSLKKLNEIEGISSEQIKEFDKNLLTRNDMVGMSYSALLAKMKTGKTLKDWLISKGVIKSNSTPESTPTSISTPTTSDVTKVPVENSKNPTVFKVSEVKIIGNAINSNSDMVLEKINKGSNEVASIRGDNDRNTPEVVITFSDLVDKATANTENIVMYVMSGKKESIKWSVSSIKDNMVKMSIPSGELKQNYSYQISIENVKSSSGTKALYEQYIFVVGSQWEVNVEGISNNGTGINGNINDGFKIVFSFDKPVEPETVQVSNIYIVRRNLDSEYFIVESTVSYEKGSKKITLIPKQSLSPASKYAIEFSGVKNTDGVLCKKVTGYGFSFTTGN